MNEKCWILLGGVQESLWWGRMVKQTEGQPCSVDFNYNWVLNREEFYGDIVGFCHTHPSFLAHPSSRDDRTMKAWVTSFGRPLVCCIHGVDGLKAWWYMDDENDPLLARSVKKLSRFIVGVTNGIETEGFTGTAKFLEDFEPITCK